MSELRTFFDMGGYAFYVWTSYGIAAIVLVLNVIGPLTRLRDTQRNLRIAIESENVQPQSEPPPATAHGEPDNQSDRMVKQR